MKTIFVRGDNMPNKKLNYTAEDINKMFEFLEKLNKDGIQYYRYGAWTSPIEGDRRDTGKGLGKNGDEVYLKGQWVKKIEVGSVGTDMITLRAGLNDLKVKELDKTFNMIRKLKTMDGIQFGSSFSPFVLTSNERDIYTYYPDFTKQLTQPCQNISSTQVTLPAYYMLNWQNADAIVKAFKFKTTKESRIRIRMYHTEENELSKAISGLSDESMVYESMPDTEFKNPDNAECYGGYPIPSGDSQNDLHNEMYLTNSRKYVIEFDSVVESGFLGNGNVPYFDIVYYEEKSTPLINRDFLEQRLNEDITLDRNMWLQTRTPDVNGKNGKEINLIGCYNDESTFVGNHNDNTVIMTKGKAKIDNEGQIGTIATEEWIGSNSIRKIMTIDELRPDETALLYKMNPPGYVSAYGQNDAEKYPMYETQGYLRKFSCVFFPMVRNANCDTFLLTHERGTSANLRFVRSEENAYCIIETDVRRLDGSLISMSIRTDLTGEPHEGYSYADQPYKPSSDVELESYKQWLIDWEISEGQCTLRVVDPNRGEWSVTKQDAAYIMDASTYFVGSFKREPATNVMRLFNIFMLVCENKDGTGEMYEINERTRGIDFAEMVTRIRKDKIKVSDSTAVHVYPKQSEDFHTFFIKSGVYYCDNMIQNVPFDTYRDNDFKAEVAVKDKDFAVIQATNLHTGVTYTKNKQFGVWQDWLTSGSVWNPKIVDYGFGDNIQIKVSKQNSYTTEEILFSNRNPKDKESVIKIELPDGWHGNYDIIIKPKKSPVSAQLVSIMLTTPTTQTPLQIGSTTVEIDENLLEIHVVANGCQWTDFGMGWKDGSYPELEIQMINKTSERGFDMLVGSGVLNQELMPKDVYLGNNLRIVNISNSFVFQKLSGSTWIEVGRIG